MKRINVGEKPFLRWAGGKTWLIKYLDEIIGNIEFNNYYEPFLGGGSIFFALEPQKKSYLSDLNGDLINAYSVVRDLPMDIIKELESFENTEEFYYYIRANEYEDKVKQAARFIYLNQTSFNGIYRVNNEGKYNVPYGFRTKEFLEKEKIIKVSEKLKNAVITCSDFSVVLNDLQEGDLVVLDPPYTVSHNENGFIKYNQKLFSLDDQYRLSVFIDQIRDTGAYYILTNAAHEKIKEIFTKEGDIVYDFTRASLIGGQNAKRGSIKEYVFTNIIK